MRHKIAYGWKQEVVCVTLKYYIWKSLKQSHCWGLSRVTREVYGTALDHSWLPNFVDAWVQTSLDHPHSLVRVSADFLVTPDIPGGCLASNLHPSIRGFPGNSRHHWSIYGCLTSYSPLPEYPWISCWCINSKNIGGEGTEVAGTDKIKLKESNYITRHRQWKASETNNRGIAKVKLDAR